MPWACPTQASSILRKRRAIGRHLRTNSKMWVHSLVSQLHYGGKWRLDVIMTLYTDDATFHGWNVGPNEDVMRRHDDPRDIGASEVAHEKRTKTRCA